MLVLGLAAEVLNLLTGRVDVLDVEVGDQALLALLLGIDAATGLVVVLEHVVLGRLLERLKLDAEQRAPELLRPPSVLRGHLEMDDLGHPLSSLD